MPANESNTQVRAYFLQQGASIAKLKQILDSNLFVHHLHKWSSILMELLLHTCFVLCFILILAIPTSFKFQIMDLPILIELTPTHTELLALVVIIKLILILFTSPLLLFAVLLGRNRKKNALIHEAFAEVKKMKEGFDGAVKGLGL